MKGDIIKGQGYTATEDPEGEWVRCVDIKKAFGEVLSCLCDECLDKVKTILLETYYYDLPRKGSNNGD